jgi:hypothetical protein
MASLGKLYILNEQGPYAVVEPTAFSVNNLNEAMPTSNSEIVGSRVEPEKRAWIEREAKKRDRSISYIVRELITEGIERRKSSTSS